MQIDVGPELVRQPTQGTSDRCVTEGRAQAPTNHSPDTTTKGKAEDVEGDGDNTSVDGVHECMDERTQQKRAPVRGRWFTYCEAHEQCVEDQPRDPSTTQMQSDAQPTEPYDDGG